MSRNNESFTHSSPPRFDADLVICYGPEQKQLKADYAVNMSIGGVFIKTTKTLPVDTPVVVKFKLTDNDTLISCNARVAWTNEPGALLNQSLPPGMGLKFIDLSLVDFRALRDFLHKDYFAPDW
jgi:uncharacterized protein (TIGR02266 family)